MSRPRAAVEQGTINPSADANWTFAPQKDTSVLFDSGPRARHFLAEVKAVKIENAGDGSDGFAR
ncbi:hypothetical protein, partial [Sinorhizobium meliloti]|uniref:hypothetical protein n=1 Tax=Rhizobium meliloti TaxID=382 RepID=UPI001AECEC69